MKRNFYTKEEIILCTYIARFGRNEFDEQDIYHLKERSVASIKMKVQNIASMLFENGFDTHSSISKLTGTPLGKIGRKTNWDIVEPLANRNKIELFNICKKII
ncbi:hypothetical protein ES711_09215 [Gelidibacter salicanalis]|uniref:Uncharacterized protein n=1 Tax=Gelidibacter salicanalis TaxID=291193 RepID=A0A5C7AIU1_9FLAO|nr:hypothetical protein [Gelidibacter salicanalis]TXE08666.1 hypothetical protein ES711_09215 [Gelidibacter salicanalis]